MAVKIKLKRMGKIRAPFYRVVVADSRTKRDGRAIEEIGKYHPTHDPSVIDINSERAQHWLSVGAQPTEAVVALFKVTGDWQKFKGLPGAEGTLQVAEPKQRQGGVPFVATGLDAPAARAAAKSKQDEKPTETATAETVPDQAVAVADAVAEAMAPTEESAPSESAATETES